MNHACFYSEVPLCVYGQTKELPVFLPTIFKDVWTQKVLCCVVHYSCAACVQTTPCYKAEITDSKLNDWEDNIQ